MRAAFLLLFAACADPPPPAPQPPRPPPPLPVPTTEDPLSLDAGLDAGPRSACVPRSEHTDGEVEQAGMTGDALAFCLAFASPLPEAPSSRACFSLDFKTELYERLAPSAPSSPAPVPDAVGTQLPEHLSASGEHRIKTTEREVSVCKGQDCQTLPLPAKGDTRCLPAGLTKAVPADVSPDGTRVFVVRNECPRTITGEIYDLNTRKLVSRAPITAPSYVTMAAWLGDRILVRPCSSSHCELALLDPRTGKASTVPGVNAWGFDDVYFKAKGDSWALVDNAGERVVWVNAKDGKVERTLDMAIKAPALRYRLAAGRRGDQIWILYGETARVKLVDLHTGEIVKHYGSMGCGR
jgi:hypothetical protein